MTVGELLLKVLACSCLFPDECPTCRPLMEEAKRLLVSEGKAHPKHEAPFPGMCRACGCTDANPCRCEDGGECCWLDDTETLCSQCAGEGE